MMKSGLALTLVILCIVPFITAFEDFECYNMNNYFNPIIENEQIKIYGFDHRLYHHPIFPEHNSLHLYARKKSFR